MNVSLVVERLSGCDPSSCATADEVADLVHDVQGVRGWLDAYEARCAARASELAAAGAGTPVAELLADGGRRRGRDAAVAASRAEICAAMPAFRDALAEGEV